MGQYFTIANLDKKEFVKTWDINCGAKFYEILCNNIARLVPYLLRKSDEYGGGDIRNSESLGYCGRWACDKIVIIGDYDSSGLYDQISEKNGWKNISVPLAEEFNSVIDFDDYRIKFKDSDDSNKKEEDSSLFDNANVIEVKLGDEDPRVCDYCDKLLVSYNDELKKLICVEDCFCTDYGLVCEKCKSDIPALKAYKKDTEYIEYGKEPVEKDRLIQVFRSNRTGELYEVTFGKSGLTCGCKGWIYRRCCKHIDYVLKNLIIRNKEGKAIGLAIKTTKIPSYQDALAMDFGRNKLETNKWLLQAIRIIEL